MVAGGSGTRMQADRPKQFIEIGGRPLLMHTLDRLHKAIPTLKIVLALPEAWQAEWAALVAQHHCTVPHLVANGGATRTLSVKSALSLVSDEHCLIGVHDGVRPFVTTNTIMACFNAALQIGAAVPVTPVIQSLRKVDGPANHAVDRNMFRAVQTPQCFISKVLREAYATLPGHDHSDDATVVEAIGQAIALVDGDERNVKITTPTDLLLARVLIDAEL